MNRLIALISIAFAAQMAQAADKLLVAQDKALAQFKTDTVVAQFYDTVTGFSVDAVERNTKGNITIKYREGQTAKTKTCLIALDSSSVTPVNPSDFQGSWKVKHLRIALMSALNSFSEEYGDATYDAITSLMIERTSGDAGRARIRYLSGGQTKTRAYFCHVHEGEGIDCH